MKRIPAHVIHTLEAATRDPATSLHFTPVKLRARRDGWTPERQRRFVAALAVTGRTGAAAALVGMSVQTAGRLSRRSDGESFSRACAEAYGLHKYARRAAARAKGSNVGLDGGPRHVSDSSASEPFKSGRPTDCARLSCAENPVKPA